MQIGGVEGGGDNDFKFTCIGRFPSNGAASMAVKGLRRAAMTAIFMFH